jgi:hypothetical protein
VNSAAAIDRDSNDSVFAGRVKPGRSRRALAQRLKSERPLVLMTRYAGRRAATRVLSFADRRLNFFFPDLRRVTIATRSSMFLGA